jgi:hypothetical protein
MFSGVPHKTFNVAETKFNDAYPPNATTIEEFMAESESKKRGGKVVKATESDNLLHPDLGNGFVGAAFRAYNSHYEFVVSPDDVWIAITTALAAEVDRHPEGMRDLFVNHKGKKELVVTGIGSIHTADYDKLIDLMSSEIDSNTKDCIKSWVECNFSTTTPKIRTISKVVLMGAMKNYFSYKICLKCGLPTVTLLGTVEDWKEIRNRVAKLATWNIGKLTNWSRVLELVLDKFIDAFDGNVDVDFWNRIAHQTGGGSGPRYLQGWILAFIPFDDSGNYVLNDINTIKETGQFGRVDTNNVPASAVEVPVTIDDNGTEYKTMFCAGALVSKRYGPGAIGTSLDWALIDVTGELLEHKESAKESAKLSDSSSKQEGICTITSLSLSGVILGAAVAVASLLFYRYKH